MSDSLFHPLILLLFILVFTIDCSSHLWDIPIKLQNWPAFKMIGLSAQVSFLSLVSSALHLPTTEHCRSHRLRRPKRPLLNPEVMKQKFLICTPLHLPSFGAGSEAPPNEC